MMCWEAMNDLPEKEPHKEQEKEEKKPVEKTEKSKHEEEHVKPTLNTGNQLKSQSKNLVGSKKIMDPHWIHKKQNNMN